MKVVLCWTNISGYMAACWRELSSRPGIDLKILAFGPTSAGWEVDFTGEIVAGLNCDLLDANQRNDAGYVRDRVIAEKPDAVIVPGWFHQPFVKLAFEPGLGNAKFIMGMDTGFNGSWRQRLARFKIGKYLDRMHTVVVAGERAFELATFLGVPEAKILRGVYGYDDAPLAELHARRCSAPWPKAFLYAGRYVPDKAIDVLLDAYAKYRSAVSDPWPLTCCGQGPLKAQVASAAGVKDMGFVQPKDLPAVMLEHGASILVSRFEPWGVALAEVMAAGLPVICSERCGASVELVRHLHNGLIVPTEDVGRTADALRWMHEHYAELSAMGLRGREFAIAHTAQKWADRWYDRLMA